jgi:alpha-L-fucosidase
VQDPNGPTLEWQRKNFGDHWTYPDFESAFKPILFNATQWIDLFIKAGIRYVVPTSKHHDGYAMFQTKYSWNWNAVDLTPKRDLIGEIRDAVLNASVNQDADSSNDLHFGFYYSLYEWFHPLYHDFDDKSQYVDHHYLPQIHEVINQYKPDIVWTDGMLYTTLSHSILACYSLSSWLMAHGCDYMKRRKRILMLQKKMLI